MSPALQVDMFPDGFVLAVSCFAANHLQKLKKREREGGRGRRLLLGEPQQGNEDRAAKVHSCSEADTVPLILSLVAILPRDKHRVRAMRWRKCHTENVVIRV